MFSIVKVASTLGFILFTQATALAALTDLQNGSVYDSVRDVTWTQDVRYLEIDLYSSSRLNSLYGSIVENIDGSTHVVGPTDIYYYMVSSFAMTGGTWWGATAWATTLNFQGIGGWRLPTSAELIGVLSEPEYFRPGGSIFTRGLSPFSYLFWTSTEVDAGRYVQVQYDSYPTPGTIYVDQPLKEVDRRADFILITWAVHDGNISAVPEPNINTLLLFGLAVIVAVSQHQKLRRMDI